MISIDVEFEKSEIEKLLSSLPKKDVQTVFKRAIVHEGKKFRTAEKRALAEITGLPVGRVAKALNSRVSAKALEFVLTARGKYTTLKEFKPVQTPRGVMASPWGRRQMFESAFKVKTFDDVFVRDGPARGPISPIYGPAIPIELVREKNETRNIMDNFHDAVGDRVLHELWFHLHGGGRR